MISASMQQKNRINGSESLAVNNNSFSIESHLRSSQYDISSLIDSIVWRLEVVDEVEIVTDTNVLQRYDYVWQNVHWFEGVQTIYPTRRATEDNNVVRELGTPTELDIVNNWRVEDCPSAECLNGAKLMQESLLLYKLEMVYTSVPSGLASTRLALPVAPPSPFFKHSNLSAESLAMIDICSRLLVAAKHSHGINSINTDIQVSAR